MKIIIDGDLLVCRAGFAIKTGPSSHAIQAMKYMIRSILYQLSFDSDKDTYVVAIGGSTNFRNDVAVTRGYKANRAKLERPPHYEELRKYLVEHHDAIVSENCEGDDVLGYLCDESNGDIIVTQDKDLDMIPGKHFDPVSKQSSYVNHTQAYRTFCYQVLVGDSVDNVPGCKGIGPIKARRILNPPKPKDGYKSGDPRPKPRDKAWMLQQVKDAYKRQGHDDEYFQEQAKLIWIWREKGGIYDEEKH